MISLKPNSNFNTYTHLTFVFCQLAETHFRPYKLTGWMFWMLSVKLPMKVSVLILWESLGILPKRAMKRSSSLSSFSDRPSLS